MTAQAHTAMTFCNACQATPKHGYCNLPGCPQHIPEHVLASALIEIARGTGPRGTRAVLESAAKSLIQAEEARSAFEQMVENEEGGGDGWWKGWEMLKAAHAKTSGWGGNEPGLSTRRRGRGWR